MNRLLLLPVIVTALSACTVYKEYPIEIYKPGAIAYPSNTENVAIVYRNFKYIGDTLQHYYKDDFTLRKVRKDPQQLDSVLVNLCLNELARNLKENAAFEEIRIFPKLFEPHTGNKLPALDMKMVQKIASSTQADLVISLETYSYFFSEYESTAELASPSNEVITAAVWAVYNPVEEKLIERKTMIDTIF